MKSKAVELAVAPVVAPGAPASHIWDVTADGRPIARVMALKNKLVTLTGDLVGHRKKVEALIEKLYAR